jgi:hypothetical protein
MSDAKSVPDIVVNPLLLSLLCNLYKVEGQLPNNRHSVYRKCAELLYSRWDSARQITLHEDMPDYGNRILESIAHFFWSSPEAAAKAEERQLVKIIAVELERQAHPSSATSRAESFLEFCAGRLWLLVKTGNNSRGQTVFDFAHRTFMEYFAAEFLARRADTANDLAAQLIKAHARDSTSVVPELLLQSFEEKRDQGASRVFIEICKDSSSSSLLLRLINGPLLKDARMLGLKTLNEMSGGGYPVSTVELFLRLHEDARVQVIECLRDSEYFTLRRDVLAAWARYCAAHRWSIARVRHGWWVEEMDLLAEQDVVLNRELCAPQATKSMRTTDLEDYADRLYVVNWLAWRRAVSHHVLALDQLLLVGGGGASFGLAFTLFAGEQREADAELWDWLRRLITESCAHGNVVSRRFLNKRVFGDSPPPIFPAVVDDDTFEAAVGLVCLFRELRFSQPWLERAVLDYLNKRYQWDLPDLRVLTNARGGPNGSGAAREEELREFAEQTVGLPSWFRAWANRQHNLVV